MIHPFNSIWGFDFKVRFGKHIVNLVPGEQISIKVFVDRVRGTGHVYLTANTQWEGAGLTSKIGKNDFDLQTQGWESTLMIKASGSTKPGSYLFTVRAEARGTFHTSEDAVMVVVTDKRDRPRQEDEEDFSGNDKENASEKPSDRFSMDDIFSPRDGTDKKVLPKIPKVASSATSIFAMLVIYLFVGGVLAFLIYNFTHITVNPNIPTSVSVPAKTTTVAPQSAEIRRCIKSLSGGLLGAGRSLPNCGDGWGGDGQPKQTILNSQNIGICRRVSNTGCSQR